MNRKALYGIAVAVAIPLVIVIAFGLTLLGQAHKLHWQETSTRIPVTPSANLPSIAQSPTEVASGAPTTDDDPESYDPGAYAATDVPTETTDAATEGYDAGYGDDGNSGAAYYDLAVIQVPTDASGAASPSASDAGAQRLVTEDFRGGESESGRSIGNENGLTGEVYGRRHAALGFREVCRANVSKVDIFPTLDGPNTGLDLSRGLVGIVVRDQDQRDVVGQVGKKGRDRRIRGA